MDRWTGGQVDRWTGGKVVRWSGSSRLVGTLTVSLMVLYNQLVSCTISTLNTDVKKGVSLLAYTPL